MTTRPRTPFAWQAASTSDASELGTATHGQIHRVRDVGDRRVGAHAEHRARAVRVTGYTGPEKPPRSRFCRTAWPSLVGSSDAPMTAIDAG